MLSEQLLAILRAYWKRARSPIGSSLALWFEAGHDAVLAAVVPTRGRYRQPRQIRPHDLICAQLSAPLSSNHGQEILSIPRQQDLKCSHPIFLSQRHQIGPKRRQSAFG
jgi:hypothetical protein